MKNWKRACFVFGIIVLFFIPFFPMQAADQNKTESGSATGYGRLEGYVNMKIFRVVLPTVPGDAFDFKLDPQGLIASTGGSSLNGAAYTDSSLYFANHSGASTSYSDTTDAFTIMNKGTVPVHVTVNAKAVNLSGNGYAIGLTKDSTFTNNMNSDLYFQLKLGNNAVALSKENGATLTTTLAGAADGAYQVVYNGSRYEYKLSDSATESDFSKVSFSLKGACNPYATWSKNAAPSLDVVWTVDDQSYSATGGSEIMVTDVVIAAGDPLPLPGNLDDTVLSAGVAAIYASKYPDSIGNILSSKYYTYDAANNTVVLDDEVASEVPSGTIIYYTVVFNDAARTKVKIEVTYS